MRFRTDTLRRRIVAVLGCVGLLRPSRAARRRARDLLRLATNVKQRQRRRAARRHFQAFSVQYAKTLGCDLRPSGNGTGRTALFISKRHPTIEVELCLLKALEMAGFTPVVLVVSGDRQLRAYFELAGIANVGHWLDFLDAVHVSADPDAIVARCRSSEDLMNIEHEGVSVGHVAVATVLRESRLGSIDLSAPAVRHALARQLTSAMAAAVAARRLWHTVKPDLVLSVDTEYTPQAQIFDVCLANGADAIKYTVAQRPSSLLFRRYTPADRAEHPGSLSTVSWGRLRNLEWNETHRDALRRELYNGYASGDWYGIWGTQFDKELLAAEQVRTLIGLDPFRKSAFIFPHIPWDASRMWGKDLFRDYEEWFVETVRAACANPRVNWVIKIHPAHVGKGLKEGFRGEPAELRALRHHIGTLPSHVFLIPADSRISTWSLFELMDYCITVRGTIGIEAASLGIPVLTAGTGRYDCKGFTVDSESREQYLERIAHIQEIPPLSPRQRELAERFAYGLFVLRPLVLTSVTFGFTKDTPIGKDWTQTRTQTNVQGRINVATREDWLGAQDLRAWAAWVADRTQPDFLMPSAVFEP